MDMMRTYFDDLVMHEGCLQYLYCDNRGFVTTGIGHLVKGPEAAVKLPFFHKASGDIAQPEEKRAAFIRAQDAFRKNKAATAYADCSDLRLSATTVQELCTTRLENEFIPAIKRECPDFDNYPPSAKRALVDIAYNVGTVGFTKFSHMLEYANTGKWDGCAISCHRKREPGESEKRNNWAEDMFRQAEKEAAAK
jgi:GH24 family phage-related lysozyme (muramidase)